MNPSSASGHDAVNLDEYLALWPGLDRERVRTYVQGRLKQLKLRKEDRIGASPDPLEQHWYESVQGGTPDFGVYHEPEYVGDLWACWMAYSRGYLKGLRDLLRRGLLLDVESVADLGCGPGYTTAEIKQMWPLATVVGTNLPGSQFEVAKRLGEMYGFTIEPELSRPVDLVFASEYFEHFQRPFNHLEEIIHIGQPRYFVHASTFAGRSIGHFPTYLDERGREVPGKTVGRIFSGWLRGYGYAKVETGFWNNRPSVWSRR